MALPACASNPAPATFACNFLTASFLENAVISGAPSMSMTPSFCLPLNTGPVSPNLNSSSLLGSSVTVGTSTPATCRGFGSCFFLFLPFLPLILKPIPSSASTLLAGVSAGSMSPVPVTGRPALSSTSPTAPRPDSTTLAVSVSLSDSGAPCISPETLTLLGSSVTSVTWACRSFSRVLAMLSCITKLFFSLLTASLKLLLTSALFRS